METQILDVRGVEVEIRAWRNRPYTFEAHFTKGDGSPVDLSNANAVFALYDRSGGALKFSQTNNPANHANASGGVTRFHVPTSAYAGLTGQRAFTWKYEVYWVDLVTLDSTTHFFGDFRVMAPQTA